MSGKAIGKKRKNSAKRRMRSIRNLPSPPGRLYLDHGGDVNLALSLAQRVKQKMPRPPLAADTLGWAYYKLGSFDSAVAQLRESVKEAPNNAMFGFHLRSEEHTSELQS